MHAPISRSESMDSTAILGFAKRAVVGLGLKKPARAVMDAYARAKPHRRCVRHGITYQLDLSQTIDRAIYTCGWEPETVEFLRSHVRPGDTVVEVGANIGAHTLLLASLVGPAGHVHAFEPTQYALAKLRTNLGLNPEIAGRIRVHTNIVTNHEGATPNRALLSQFRADSAHVAAEQVSAAATCLDDQDFGGVALLKIDVDGYDHKVLSGAERLIRASRPLVLIELCNYTLGAQGDSVADIVALMDSLGYRGYRESGAPLPAVDRIVVELGGDKSINAVFRPI